MSTCMWLRTAVRAMRRPVTGTHAGRLVRQTHTLAPRAAMVRAAPLAFGRSVRHMETMAASGSSVAPPKVSSEELEIKDATVIFNRVWDRVTEVVGGEKKLVFPREIIWLGGAPGAGKGTNSPFITQNTGITAPPIIMSSLLDSPELQLIKDSGRLVTDETVLEVLLTKVLDPQYENGVLIDGFPRTVTQVSFTKMLEGKMFELRRKFKDKPWGHQFRRPRFRVAVLFVDEATAIERQLRRGQEAIRANAYLEENSMPGRKRSEVRVTDLSEDHARDRYKVFKEHYETLEKLQEHFPFHLIDASGTLKQVQQRIAREFRYQSELELSEQTYGIVSRIPVARNVCLHARQKLVRRLDGYTERDRDLFDRVVTAVEEQVIPTVLRNALSGSARVEVEGGVWSEKRALDMAIDVLSERGFFVNHDVKLRSVPVCIDPKTYEIKCDLQRIERLTVEWERTAIRRR